MKFFCFFGIMLKQAGILLERGEKGKCSIPFTKNGVNGWRKSLKL